MKHGGTKYQAVLSAGKDAADASVMNGKVIVHIGVRSDITVLPILGGPPVVCAVQVLKISPVKWYMEPARLVIMKTLRIVS